ncbi:hypothetical protein PITC_069760 [Penicillium italicum]|uniref:Uncharacterized protein n=1 Tax=Penicillium italicum TaxID=40296 RepID=A0A0A2L7G7_PENIT|nr:hypothetical protein PITC_069760 [Penicillium italicum]
MRPTNIEGAWASLLGPSRSSCSFDSMRSYRNRDVSADNQSATGASDHQSSWVRSGKRDLDQEMENIGDLPMHGDGDIGLDDIPPSEDMVPDSEYIDWHGVPRHYEALLEDNPPPDVTMSGLYNTRLERKDGTKLRVVTKGTAKETLYHDTSLRFFHSIILPRNTAMEQFQLAEEDIVRRIDERQLHDFLAILIFAYCSIKAARTFTTKLVAKDLWPVLATMGKTIYCLPADREELIELFGNKVAAEKVFTYKLCFCPVVIRMRGKVRVQTPEEQRLPYLEEQELGKGAYGTTFNVRIAKGDFYGPQVRTANLEPVEIARKDYMISDNVTAQEHR